MYQASRRNSGRSSGATAVGRSVFLQLLFWGSVCPFCNIWTPEYTAALSCPGCALQADDHYSPPSDVTAVQVQCSGEITVCDSIHLPRPPVRVCGVRPVDGLVCCNENCHTECCSRCFDYISGICGRCAGHSPRMSSNNDQYNYDAPVGSGNLSRDSMLTEYEMQYPDQAPPPVLETAELIQLERPCFIDSTSLAIAARVCWASYCTVCELRGGVRPGRRFTLKKYIMRSSVFNAEASQLEAIRECRAAGWHSVAGPGIQVEAPEYRMIAINSKYVC